MRQQNAFYYELIKSSEYSEIFWYNSDFPCDLSLILSGIMTNH